MTRNQNNPLLGFPFPNARSWFVHPRDSTLDPVAGPRSFQLIHHGTRTPHLDHPPQSTSVPATAKPILIVQSVSIKIPTVLLDGSNLD